MIEKNIQTNLGKIAIAIEEKEIDTPIIFMHGMFLDRSLWADYDSNLTGRTHIYLDMPGHGQSSNVGRDWTLDDCVEMLMIVLEELKINQCIAIGQSWGSMTALRAASKFPKFFQALGLFNMPFKQSSGFDRLGFNLQKLIVGLPRCYGKQAAKILYSPEILRQRPELSSAMAERLAQRPSQEIYRCIDAVILNTKNTTQILHKLQVPVLAVVGKNDYVGIPPKITTIIAPGGHITPHESIAETKQAIKKVIKLADAKNQK